MNIFKFLACLALVISTIASASDISIVEHSAWVRATPPGAKTTAIYLSLKNHTDSDISLVAAKSNISERLELHTHLQEDSMMKMRQVNSITAAPGSTIDLKPHGLHIMVFNLSETLKDGETVELTLLFEDQTNLELTVPVSKEGPSSIQKHDSKEHEHSN